MTRDKNYLFDMFGFIQGALSGGMSGQYFEHSFSFSKTRTISVHRIRDSKLSEVCISLQTSLEP